MKKPTVLLVLAPFVFAFNGIWGQKSQWNVYNNIPNFKEISLYFSDEDALQIWAWTDGTKNGVERKGANLSMSIYDDYSVGLYYSNPMIGRTYGFDVNVPFTIKGNGILLWQNEHMVLKLEVTKYSPGEEYYIGGQWDSKLVYSSINSTTTYTYDVEYKESGSSGYFVFRGNDIEATRRKYDSRTTTYGANVTDAEVVHTDRLRISGTHYIKEMKQKSQSEMNTQYSDMYGKWQWNDDRSVIYLESTTKDAYLILWNYDGILSWGFQLSTTASGYKTETADSGETLANMMVSFDGASEQSFSFAKTESSGKAYFQYVQYDRFLGTLKRDASIINQIKDKRTLVLNYKQNGSTKTAMFQLEGLEAIYNAITQ